MTNNANMKGTVCLPQYKLCTAGIAPSSVLQLVSAVPCELGIILFQVQQPLLQTKRFKTHSHFFITAVNKKSSTVNLVRARSIDRIPSRLRIHWINSKKSLYFHYMVKHGSHSQKFLQFPDYSLTDFFLINIKFPWPTELTTAQISPDNGLNPLLRAILFTHFAFSKSRAVYMNW